jgi:hypothetical protein
MNSLEHFASINKQDGMICLCCAPDADRVTKMSYARVLLEDFNPPVKCRSANLDTYY